MMETTIPVDEAVRERLRTFGHHGTTYNDILTRLMDEVERRGFIAELRRAIDDPTTDWVELDDFDWGE